MNVLLTRAIAVCVFLAPLNIYTGCSLAPGPSRTVETLYRTVEHGDTDSAATFFSTGFISRQGIDSLKRDLSNSSLEIKEHGGIKSFRSLKEDVVGNVAEVSVEITRGNGNVLSVQYKLIKEQGAWKIDDLELSSPATIDPSHPETAVADVVKWAHEANSRKLQDWLKSQPSPAVCTVPAIDRNKLPDEVRYHDVDDSSTRAKLTIALQPVLKLVGCTNTNGVVLYRGLNMYAGSIDGGWIAITSGESYFTAAAPDERIFHELGKLRIFFAREVFRQIVPIDAPDTTLNQADMLLRRDLKLSYLAALASLEIDRDPAILDRVALDLDLFAKPVGMKSGARGVPTLNQIQNILGAAKQDHRAP
ncbi:MAG: hypothetical protein QOE77_3321 [Blastocatellia bacterium]|jgi:hypothetical protein|nr:hypothetical protein [Blastocatellia bacterium]